MRTQAVSLTRLDAALEAANTLAHHAALALEDQRSGHGLSPAAYRKRVRDIRSLVWCAINDLGRAKRQAVVDEHTEKEMLQRIVEAVVRDRTEEIRQQYGLKGGAE